MFGRESERAQVERVLEATASGPVGLALEGTPGVGKTTIWADAVQSARKRGFLVLSSSPSEPEASLAFTALGDLLDSVPAETLDELPEPQRRALAAAMSIEEAGAAPADWQVLSRGVLNVLRSLAARSPTVVALDDEQWLDGPSGRTLAFALSRLREERVCVLLSRRVASEGPLWPELARSFSPIGSLVLQPLDLEAIQAILVAELGRKFARSVSRRIYEVSGGNPLYALAIARELDATNGTRSGSYDVRVPVTLEDAIAARLERLDAGAREPLLVTAAASNPTVSLVQAVLPDFRLSDLEEAERTGVAEVAGERVHFTHPLLASIHYSRCSARRRRELHRLLAAVLVGEEERAHHMALGAEAPDHETAAALESAARHAARRGAPEVAAELLAHCCRLTPADAIDQLQARRIALAEQHEIAGDLEAARSMLREIVEQFPAGTARARALLLLARLSTHDLVAGLARYEQAIVEAGDELHVRIPAECELSELCGVLHDPQGEAEHARAAVGLAERLGDKGLLAQALARLGRSAFLVGEGIRREQLERAIELEHYAEDVSSYNVPSTVLGSLLVASDQPEAARPLFERSLRRAVARGEEADRFLLLFFLARSECEVGKIDAAKGYARDAGEAAGWLVDEQLDAFCYDLDSWLALRLGDLVSARVGAEAAISAAERIGDRWIAAYASTTAAMIELWSGRPEAAHGRFVSARAECVSYGRPVGFLMLPMWWADIEALIAIGRHQEAEEVLEDFFERAERAANPNAIAIAHRCEGLLLAARGTIVAAVDAMDHALAEHEHRPLPLEIGRTLLEKGALERRAKRKTAAKRTLEEALAILEPLEAAMWIGRARDELSRIGLRRATVVAGLTPAQARVAELVAAGMSTREIAGTLYMSPRSVESHLTKIYREYRVRSRAQLATALAARASHDQTHPSSS